MSLDTEDFDSLMTDIAGMASRMDADGAGAPVAKRILEAAAVPIYEQMKANASSEPLYPDRQGTQAQVQRQEHHHRRTPQGGGRILRPACGVRPWRPGSRACASFYPSRL